MPAPSYKFSELIDRLLVRLYELDRGQSSLGEFFDLLKVSQELKEPPPDNWVIDAAKVMQSMGLATILINSAIVGAQISGQGRLYVEEERGTTGKIKRKPGNYHVKGNVKGNYNQISVGGSGSQTMTAEHENALTSRLLKDIKDSIKTDASLRPADQSEALGYLELIAKEMKKSEPNRNILAAILEPLSKITSIAGKIATLIQIING